MSPAGGWDGEWYEHRPRLPGPGERRPGRSPFGTSWWGRAWVEALEQRASLDPNRLPRGRTYARTGAVGTLTLAPGEVVAEVQGSRRTPYKVRVRVRAFTDPEWNRVLDALAAEIGHTAALLEGELPAGVADDVRRIGLDLLPGPGEVQPRCSCPDWADPCKHAAAVCYLVADALDADAFGVLLLRGRARDEVLAGLRSRRHAGAPSTPRDLAPAADADPGVLARDAWAGGPDVSAALPALPSPPRRPGPAAVLGADPPTETGVDLSGLRFLAADAAARALALLRSLPPAGAADTIGSGPTPGSAAPLPGVGVDAGAVPTSTGLELSVEVDLARRAAALLARDPAEPDRLAGPPMPVRPGDLGLDELARRAGVPGHELLRRALAFRYGGVAGLAALTEAFDPDPAQVEAGRALLGPGGVSRRNRVTAGTRQVRLGHDGRWYPYAKDRSGRWRPDGPPLVPAGASDSSGGTVDEVGSLDE